MITGDKSDELFNLSTNAVRNMSMEDAYKVGEQIDALDAECIQELGVMLISEFLMCYSMMNEEPDMYPWVKRPLPNISYIS